jgi:hypothetical protein
MQAADDSATQGRTPLKDRMSHVLDELRVVLPGTQALLGFQLIAVFSDGFKGLEDWARYVHFASLLLVAFSAVLLMTPASYHRIVEAGNDSERLHGFATRCIIAAMAALGTGLALDLGVVSFVVFGSEQAAAVVTVVAMSVFAGAWFVMPMVVRAHRDQSG